MDRFLVHSAGVHRPAVHVMVIGVSAYPHLVRGAGRRCSCLTTPKRARYCTTYAAWLGGPTCRNPLRSCGYLCHDRDLPCRDAPCPEGIPPSWMYPGSGRRSAYLKGDCELAAA